ncbi:peptide chain release factor 2 [Candidatus Campbellbacteria bacterium]|nr:MAG: peptide chain release factor 2 [Candidatus Campbellbacteria bacterium]
MNNEEKVKLQKEIEKLEQLTYSLNFWKDPQKAQEILEEIKKLNILKEGGEENDLKSCVISIFAGTGGDDAEDFVRILFQMYFKFCEKNNFEIQILSQSPNEQKGYKNISFEILNKGSYGLFKNENGVHRLVRKSPFNAKSKRQTSFAKVEVLPNIEQKDFQINESDFEISFAKSQGSGGQNVNKRETAVRIVDKKSGISVFVSEGRTQEYNKKRAFDLIRAKLYLKHKEDQEKIKQGLKVNDKVEISWGSQMRNYIFDPYKMIKDTKQNIEITNIQKVLNGDLSDFIKL